MSSWETYIDNFKDEICNFSKDELKNLVKSSKEDSNEFVRKQGAKLELYLNLLATEEITKEQFASYILDIKDLAELHALKTSVEGKHRVQNFIKGLKFQVINGLITGIKNL